MVRSGRGGEGLEDEPEEGAGLVQEEWDIQRA